MPEVSVRAGVPGPEAAVLALWDDTTRWPAFVDGFRAVVRMDPEWPAPGAVVIWDTGQHGAGRTRERSVAPGVREVETQHLNGSLTAAFAGDELTVSLAYELKQRNLYTLFFVRRALRDALRRTVGRFAIERRADAELVS